MIRQKTIERSQRIVSLIDAGKTPEMVADLLGIGVKTVSNLYCLGTGKRMPRRKPKSRFPAGAISWLGKFTDDEIGRKLRMSRDAVRRYRNSLGIAPLHVRGPAASVVVPKAAVKLMGRMSDDKIAQKFGLSESMIGRRRRRLGISSFRDERKAKMRLPPIPQEAIDLFGKVPDAEIAEKFGLKMTRLREKRHRMGIPCFGKQENGNTDQDWSWWVDPRPPAKCVHEKPNELCAICERAQRTAMAFAASKQEEDEEEAEAA